MTNHGVEQWCSAYVCILPTYTFISGLRMCKFICLVRLFLQGITENCMWLIPGHTNTYTWKYGRYIETLFRDGWHLLRHTVKKVMHFGFVSTTKWLPTCCWNTSNSYWLQHGALYLPKINLILTHSIIIQQKSLQYCSMISLLDIILGLYFWSLICWIPDANKAFATQSTFGSNLIMWLLTLVALIDAFCKT